MKQTTLGNPIHLEGKGLHTGLHINMTLLPAPANSGISIKRKDLPSEPCMAAVAENVAETTRGTVLRQGEMQVGTVEHGLSALYAAGIDNCLIELDAPEFPILDGSAKYYMSEIAKAGVVELDAEKRYFAPQKKIEYTAPNGVTHIEILPAETFSLEVEIDFNSPVLGRQTACFAQGDDYINEIAPCRTFVFVRELEPLLKMNLIKGGDLTNALVIYDTPIAQRELEHLSELLGQPCPKVESLGYLNNDLRFDNEPARHKLLDLIGDLSLIGCPIKGRVIATHPGHAANTAMSKLIRTLINDNNCN